MANEDQVEQQAKLLELMQQANNLGKQYQSILQSQHEVMASMFNISKEGMSEYTEEVDSLANALSSLEKDGGKLNRSLGTQEKALSDLDKAAEMSEKALRGLGRAGLALTPIAVGFETLGKTFTALTIAGSSLVSVLGGIIGTVFRLGLGLLALPIGIINSLFAEAQTGGSNEFRRQLEEVRKIFGDLSRNESRSIIQSFRNIRGELAQTGLSSYRILGNMAERLEFVSKTAQAMGVAFSLIQGQLVANVERFAAYIKGLGLSEEAQGALARRSVATGVSITELGRQMTNYAYQVGEAFGFNGKQISRDVGNMMADFDTFGNLSIQTLTNVAVYARRLGVEFSKLKGVVSQFDDFDKAAESVARLSQAFGLQVDTMQLVNAQDPAERIELLRKSFFAAGRSIESMTRQERALLATQTGLDQETLSLVFSQKSQATSYADIQRKSEQARKHQLTQAEAMEKLSNSIERLVKDGQSLQGGLFDILFAGFAAGIRRSGPFRELMRDIRHLMREVFRVGREMGRMFVELFPGIRQVFGGLGNFLSPRGIGRHFQVLKQQFKEFLTGLTPANAGKKLRQFIDNMRQNFIGALQGPGLSDLMNGLRTIGAVVLSMVGEMIKYVGEGIANAMNSAAEFIRNPQAFLASLRQGASTAGNGMVSVLAPLWEALVEVAPVFGDALMNLLGAVWDRFKTWAINFFKEHWIGIMGVLFGPSLIMSAISAVGATFAGAFVSGAAGILGRAFAGIGGLISGRGGGGGIARALGGLGAATEAADDAASSASRSSSLTNPASIAKLLVVAAVIGIGMFALVRGMVALAELLKEKHLTASDVGLAVLTMGAAVAIGTALGAAVSALSGVAGTIASQAGPIAIAVLAIGAVGAALALGMTGLISLFSGVDVGAVGVTSVAMIAAIGIAGGIALATIGFAGLGALIAGTAPVIAAGLLAVGIVGAALAAGMFGLVTFFEGTNIGDIVKVGIVMTTALNVVASITMAMATLAGAGALATLAPVIAVGMLAVVAMAEGMKLGLEAIIGATRRISLGALLATSAVIGGMVGIISKLAMIGVVLAASAPALGIAATLSRVTTFAIKTISEGMMSAVSGLISNIARMPASAELQTKVNMFVNIIQAVVGFGNSIRGMLETGSIFEGIGNRVRAINSLVNTITGRIKDVVMKFIDAASGLPDVSVLRPKLEIITTIITAVGTFARGLLNTGTRDEDAIEALESYATNVVSQMTRFVATAMPRLSELISTIASSSSLSGANIEVIRAFGEIINVVFSSLGTVIRTSISALTRQGSIITDTEELAEAAPVLGQAIGRMVSGLFGNNNLFTSINSFIDGLVVSLGNVSLDEVEKVKAFASILGPLFNAISSISMAVAQLGAGALTADTGAIASLRATVSAIAGGVSSELSTLVTNLVTTLSGISGRSIQMIQRSSVMLRDLFSNITELFNTVREYGSAEGGNSTGRVLQNGFRNVALALFGGEGSGWSLKAFVDLFNPGGSMAQLVTQLESNKAVINSSMAGISSFKQAITQVFGVVDEQFTSGLSQGLNSTLSHVNSTLEEIISNINDVHNKINQVGSSININAALANLGESIGTANPQRLQIARGDLTINITVNVKLDVDDIEEAIATRSNGSSFVISKEAQTRRPHLTGATPTYPG